MVSRPTQAMGASPGRIDSMDKTQSELSMDDAPLIDRIMYDLHQLESDVHSLRLLIIQLGMEGIVEEIIE